MPSDLIIPFYVSYAAAWGLLVIQTLILLGLVRSVYQLQNVSILGGTSKGKEAPFFTGKSIAGTEINSKYLAGRLTGLLFISPTCQACLDTLEQEMNYLNHKTQRNVIIICQGGRTECAQLGEKYEIGVPIVADEDNHISELYGIAAVPTVVMINANNRILSYGQPKHEELIELLEKAA